MTVEIPLYISLLFGLTTLLAVGIFYRATRHSGAVLALLLGWMAVQLAISLTDYYAVQDTVPPRFLLPIAPPLVLIAWLFATQRGRTFIDGLRLDQLTLLHTVRLLVETVLFLLFLHRAEPVAMTFRGTNFDIFSGITAPIVYYVGFVKQRLSRGFLIGWNFLCLALVGNAVATFLLTAPSKIQLLAFDQPNVAVLHFPFTWLGTVVVPLVLFSHLAALRQLLVGHASLATLASTKP